MIVTAWNNGAHHISGAGYGIKIGAQDRDRFFDRRHASVIMRIEGHSTEFSVNTNKKTFWNKNCRELIHLQIGIWLRESRLAPWPKDEPPKLDLRRLDGGSFLLSKR